MNNRAEFKKVSEEQEGRILTLRLHFSDLYDYIEELCESSRETSLALTKLEECQFWCIKGITREKEEGK